MNYGDFESLLTPIVSGAAFLALAIFAIVSLILDHHWRKFATSRMRIYFMRSTYLIVSGILVFIVINSILFLF